MNYVIERSQNGRGKGLTAKIMEKEMEKEENIKERIINIVNYRATNKIVAYIAAVLIIIIAVGLLTVPDAAGHNIFNLLMGIS